MIKFSIKNKILNIVLIFTAFFLGILISVSYAQWFSPSGDPPTDTFEVLNTGPTAQLKDGCTTS